EPVTFVEANAPERAAEYTAQGNFLPRVPYQRSFWAQLRAMIFAGRNRRLTEVARKLQIVVRQPTGQPQFLQRLEGQIAVASDPLKTMTSGDSVRRACAEEVWRRGVVK